MGSSSRRDTYHVRALSDDLRAGLDKSLRLLARDLVLCGRWEGDVDLLEEGPGPLAGVVREAAGERGGVDEADEGPALELELADGLDVCLGVAAAGGDE